MSVVLYSSRTNLPPPPPPPPSAFTNSLPNIHVAINISIFDLIKIIAFVLLLIRTLTYAFPITVLSVRFTPFNFNHCLRRKTSQACHSTPQIEMIIIFILINELTDAGIILLIFNQELFHLKFTKYYLSRSTCYLLSAVVLIKFISFSCLFPSWMIFIRIILSNDVETNPGDFVNNLFTFCNRPVRSYIERTARIALWNLNRAMLI